MNRHERRKAKTEGKMQRMINCSLGTLTETSPVYGEQVWCRVCGAPHTARGVAIVQEPRKADVWFTVCDDCMAADPDETMTKIAMDIWNVTSLEVKDGGELTAEQSKAIYEKLSGAVEH
jgi:hypothetical protein